ncbi:MAG TPA: response regulator [Candidatus Saccharimonadales bacterium]|nr:response regulator [Candidatus Saccharimonadales bacterium]
MRVLIVDDSLTVRMDLSEAFENTGLDTTPCACLQDARAALSNDSFHLIVLDVLLPDGDGITFLSQLKADPNTAKVPVMLLSTEAQVGDRVRGLKTGADEYVGKPYDAGYVVGRGKELMNSRRDAAVAYSERVVLVIDDSATFRGEMQATLESAGYRVVTAATGEEGLQVAVNSRPSAVIVDNGLPGIDGTTVIRRVREDAALRRTPCLLLTASEDPAEELRALEGGADGFIRKDQDFSIILARLSAILRSSSTPSAFDPRSGFLGPKKILAVDDNATFREEFAAQLRQEGYDVALACSGEEALELLAVQPVDCVLLDVMMPGLSGYETCQRIKESPVLRNIPLLMLTSLDAPHAMTEGINAGADDYISKSIDFDVVRARIRAALRRKQFEDENRSVRERFLRKEMEASEARAERELAETRAAFLSKLRENEDRLRLAAEAADLGVWSWNPNSGEHEWNDQFRALLGVPPMVKPTHDVFLSRLHPEDRLRTKQQLAEALANRTDYEIECRVVCPDETIRWIVVKGRALYEGADKSVRITGVIMDVSDRKRTEAALVRSEKLASVGRMAATMAHEINNPLEAATNALFLISCDESLPPETRANVDLAERELTRVAHMTRQTLGFYREGSRAGAVNFADLMDEVVGLYSRKLTAKYIALQKTYRGSCGVNGIAGELRQVISNLMANSIDAAAAYDTIHIRVSDCHVKHYSVRLTVADTGGGIRREDMNSIFDAFFTTKKDMGTGLGLWVTRQIVEKHGGSIKVRSRVEKGTVFCVFLPSENEPSALKSGSPATEQTTEA